MIRGWLWGIGLALLTLPIAPRNTIRSSTIADITAPLATSSTDLDWVKLLERNPVESLAITYDRYRREVKSFRATLVKQERIGKVLHPEEEISIVVREEPFAVSLTWLRGARNQTQAILYVAGENGNAMRVWRPSALLAKALSIQPMDALPRSASRFSITESSLAHGHLRTYRRWKEVRDQGKLTVESSGPKSIPELDGRNCFVLKRTCHKPECDAFALNEIANVTPESSFKTVLIYLDSETGYQIGAELLREDGQRVGAYFFKNIQWNPSIPANQFSDKNWGK